MTAAAPGGRDNLPGCEPPSAAGKVCSKRGPDEASVLWKRVPKRCCILTGAPSRLPRVPAIGRPAPVAVLRGQGRQELLRAAPRRGSSRSLPSHGTMRSAGSPKVTNVSEPSKTRPPRVHDRLTFFALARRARAFVYLEDGFEEPKSWQ